MSEAQETMALRRSTGMPVMRCREAIRAHPGDLLAQRVYLRAGIAQSMLRDGRVWCTWVYPDELDPSRDPC